MSKAVLLDEVKSHLAGVGDEDNALLNGFINAALDYCEHYLERPVLAKTRTKYFDQFGVNMVLESGLNEFDSDDNALTVITYQDEDDQEQTLDSSVYKLIRLASVAEVVRRNGEAWPATLNEPESVKVTYNAGWQEADIPAAIRLPIKMLVAHYYENRETVVVGNLQAVEVPMSVTAHLDIYKSYR